MDVLKLKSGQIHKFCITLGLKILVLLELEVDFEARIIKG